MADEKCEHLDLLIDRANGSIDQLCSAHDSLISRLGILLPSLGGSIVFGSTIDWGVGWPSVLFAAIWVVTSFFAAIIIIRSLAARRWIVMSPWESWDCFSSLEPVPFREHMLAALDGILSDASERVEEKATALNFAAIMFLGSAISAAAGYALEHFEVNGA